MPCVHLSRQSDSICQNPTSFHDKEHSTIEGKLLNSVKSSYKTSTADLMQKDGMLSPKLSSEAGDKHVCSVYFHAALSLKCSLGSHSGRRNERCPDRKVRSKTVSVCRSCEILCTGHLLKKLELLRSAL